LQVILASAATNLLAKQIDYLDPANGIIYLKSLINMVIDPEVSDKDKDSISYALEKLVF
jgi:hypothetical protein